MALVSAIHDDKSNEEAEMNGVPNKFETHFPRSP